MKQRLLPLLLSLGLLCGCTGAPPAQDEDTLTILAATYPTYLFTRAVTEGVDGITVERLNTGSVSCLHDYTLSVTDMKKIEKADVIVLSGVELEEFMEDALETSDAAVIDCSEGVELLENLSHHHTGDDEDDGDDHDHDDHGHDHGHWDPHYWMDPGNACVMVENICQGLSRFDPEHTERYADSAAQQQDALNRLDQELRALLQTQLLDQGIQAGGLITFHDGFQYFAHAYDIPLLQSIEEEAGSEASAKEIVEITHLVKEYDLPVIFTEFNGSDATAKAISRETGCQVAPLTMIMDTLDSQVEQQFQNDYFNGMVYNMTTVIDAFRGSEDSK